MYACIYNICMYACMHTYITYIHVHHSFSQAVYISCHPSITGRLKLFNSSVTRQSYQHFVFDNTDSVTDIVFKTICFVSALLYKYVG